MESGLPTDTLPTNFHLLSMNNRIKQPVKRRHRIRPKQPKPKRSLPKYIPILLFTTDSTDNPTYHKLDHQNDQPIPQYCQELADQYYSVIYTFTYEIDHEFDFVENEYDTMPIKEYRPRQKPNKLKKTNNIMYLQIKLITKNKHIHKHVYFKNKCTGCKHNKEIVYRRKKPRFGGWPCTNYKSTTRQTKRPLLFVENYPDNKHFWIGHNFYKCINQYNEIYGSPSLNTRKILNRRKRQQHIR